MNSSSRSPQTGTYIYNGIDRIDSNIGYEPDNCVTCCVICNRMKNKYSKNAFLLHVSKITKYLKLEINSEN